MFANPELAEKLAIHCSAMDILCRKELSDGILVSERDYVSALLTRIRDRLQLRNISCYVQTAPSGIEKEFGVDAIMIFKRGNTARVGVFEAKRPQVTIENYQWDYIDRNNESHFSAQIFKQQLHASRFATWEMFLNEATMGFQSPPYDFWGSSCIWQRDAYRFALSYLSGVWTTSQLKELLQGKGENLYSVIFEIINGSDYTQRSFLVERDYIKDVFYHEDSAKPQASVVREEPLPSVLHAPSYLSWMLRKFLIIKRLFPPIRIKVKAPQSSSQSFSMQKHDITQIPDNAIPLPFFNGYHERISMFMRVGGINNYIYIDLDTVD